LFFFLFLFFLDEAEGEPEGVTGAEVVVEVTLEGPATGSRAAETEERMDLEEVAVYLAAAKGKDGGQEGRQYE
jgi:hypothetical protein